MIQLTKGFAMITDDCCYTVGKPRQKADGRIILDKPTYYSTAAQAVSGALVRAMRQGVADGSITTLREFIRGQERLRAELEALIAPLDSGEARQSAVEALPATQMSNYIPQDHKPENGPIHEREKGRRSNE